MTNAFKQGSESDHTKTDASLAKQENQALQRAIDYLGAVEVAPGRYAFAYWKPGDPSGEPEKWFTVPAGAFGELSRAMATQGFLTDRWFSKVEPVEMPAWWSPDRQYAWRIRLSDGALTGSRFKSGLAAEVRRDVNCPKGTVERITADLESGEEIPC